MREYITTTQKNLLWKNYHFWVIIGISSFLILVYVGWPWRESSFYTGFRQNIAWLVPLYPLAVFEFQHHIVGSLFLIPIVYASIVFKWQGSLVGLIFLAIGVFPILTGLWSNTESWIANIIWLLSPIAIVMAIKIELELRRKEKMIYIEREQEYRNYLTKILETQERERQRLAEELHDESVQTLLAVASYAESVEVIDENIAEIKSKAAWIKEKTRKTVEDLRRISMNLRPSILDEMGLISALKWLANRTNKTSNIHVHLTINNFNQDLKPEWEVNIFRIIQEALHNIEKHSKATEAYINIEASSEFIKLTIRDNGRGFILPEKLGNLVIDSKLGLIGMQERAKSLGGSFEISSKPQEGTLVSIGIPNPESRITR